ncbi:hypothetical protein PG984_013921 [Apiospora sp. TS-2023a]
MKLSITACLLGAFSSLASGYSIDICSDACDSTACCTTITGPNIDLKKEPPLSRSNLDDWNKLPAGYSGRVRHMKVNMEVHEACCDWDAVLAGNCPGSYWGSPTHPTDPDNKSAIQASKSTKFWCYEN